jgi:hypothetical protein
LPNRYVAMHVLASCFPSCAVSRSQEPQCRCPATPT